MAFGQSSGPPASAKQVQELLSLLHDAGHSDFRDARGPLGFSQRQAAGKFTRDEAEAFIERLQGEAEGGDHPAESPPPAHAAPAPVRAPAPAPAAPAPAAPAASAVAAATRQPKVAATALRRVPTEQLAAELQRRGWIVVEP
jgi:hypothetical protein